MAIHHSSLAALKRCPKKFAYSYAEKLERKREALPLKRGVWLHFMLQVDAIRRGMEVGSLLEVPGEIDAPGGIKVGVIPITDLAGGLQVIDAQTGDLYEYPLTWKGALELLEQQQWNYLPEEIKEELTEGGQDLPTACRNIMRGYLWQHRDTLAKERPLLVEVEWERTDNSGAESVDYGGRIDLVLIDAKGRLIVRDWKTTKSLPSPEYRLMERQRILYAWGIAPLLSQHDLKVDGIELDYLITKTATKPKQNQPAKPKTRKAKCLDCEGSGVVRLGDEISEDTGERLGEDLACIACEGSGKRVPDQPSANELKGELSKAKIDTTPLVYYEALLEYGLELTDYHRDKINELAQANAFYRRFPIPVNQKMLVKTLRENAQVASVGAQILKAPSLAYRVEDRSCNWTCDFVPLCMGELYGQDVNTIRKRDYQLRKALVDPLDNDDDEE